MLVSHALVLAQVGTAPSGGIMSLISAAGPMLPLVGIMVLFYIMILMPQQRRAKEHAARIAAVKRRDRQGGQGRGGGTRGRDRPECHGEGRQEHGRRGPDPRRASRGQRRQVLIANDG